jgi:hypothetical protein
MQRYIHHMDAVDSAIIASTVSTELVLATN